MTGVTGKVQSEQSSAPTELPSVMDRLNVAIHELRRAHLEPAWIILGAQDGYELKRSVDFRYDASWFQPDAVPQFRGIPIATVPVAHHLEVVPKVPR